MPRLPARGHQDNTQVCVPRRVCGNTATQQDGTHRFSNNPHHPGKAALSAQTRSHDHALIKSRARQHRRGQRPVREPRARSHGWSGPRILAETVNRRAQPSPEPPGASVRITEVTPPSSVPGHVFLFPRCPRGRSQEDTRLTASVASETSRRTSRARGHSPCPGTPSPLAALSPFSCFGRNRAKPGNRDVVPCLTYNK